MKDIALSRVKQLLVNNSYPVQVIDKHISDAISKYVSPPVSNTEQGTILKLFYRNSMSPAYKTDEKVLRSIVSKCCKPLDSNNSLKLIIYYQNPTTRSLVMANNLSQDKSVLKQSDVIYQ